MQKHIERAGLIRIIGVSQLVGLLNWGFYVLVKNTHAIVKADEVATSIYVSAVFLGLFFFAILLCMKAEEEWNKVLDAVATSDKKEFLVLAPRRISSGIWTLYSAISILALFSFHLFQIEGTLAIIEIQVGIGFLVTMIFLIMRDLDNPINGVINVPNIPTEWLEEIAGKQ